MSYVRVSHNAYIQVAAELGLIGLAVYLFLMGLAFFDLIRTGRFLYWEGKSLEGFGLAQALLGSLIGYAFCSLFLSVAYYPHLYILLGLCLAFTCAYRVPDGWYRPRGAVAGPEVLAGMQPALPGGRGQT